MTGRQWHILWIFLLLAGNIQAQLYRLPEIPKDITAPDVRADFLMRHYWDHFQFADQTWESQRGFVEQVFVDFLQVRPYASAEVGEAATVQLLRLAQQADTLLFAFFTELSEKYLYDPDSPMYEEEGYIPVLRYICSSKRISALDKVRPQYQLEGVLKNRKGNVAADFAYALTDGEEKALSDLPKEYTLLFFNDPDCERCRQMKQALEESALISEKLIRELTILAVYTGDEPDVWKQERYPASWINSCDVRQSIRERQLYDLRVMPVLYLLDRERKVVLKNTSVSAVEDFFRSLE